MAAAVRVGLTTGKDFRIKAREMKAALNSSDLVVKKAIWGEWYRSSFYIRIEAAYDQCKTWNISPSRMLIQLIAKDKGSENQIQRALHRIEGKLYEAVLRADCPDKEKPAARARVTLCRWEPSASPADADRLLRISGIIGRLTQPCIHAAVIRCWKNGWVTARRMRTLNPTRRDACIFGCSATAHDSLEHYVCCSKLQDAGKRAVIKERHGCIPYGIRQAVLLEGAECETDIYFRALWLFCFIPLTMRLETPLSMVVISLSNVSVTFSMPNSTPYRTNTACILGLIMVEVLRLLPILRPEPGSWLVHSTWMAKINSQVCYVVFSLVLDKNLLNNRLCIPFALQLLSPLASTPHPAAQMAALLRLRRWAKQSLDLDRGSGSVLIEQRVVQSARRLLRASPAEERKALEEQHMQRVETKYKDIDNMWVRKCSVFLDELPLSVCYRTEGSSYLDGNCRCIDEHLVHHDCRKDIMEKEMREPLYNMNLHWSMAQQVRNHFNRMLEQTGLGETCLVYDFKFHFYMKLFDFVRNANILGKCHF